jgi:UDP-N-acetylglucosamine--N-acetylmuramyl-(pentapeptide) pyrophosphoryl-undecaprenol N-acetylglucosamine transferase
VPRVVIAAGGTAGHVVPAMAVADELRARGAEVSFLGTRERIEADLVPAAGYEIDYLAVRGLDRRNPLKAAAAAARAAAAVPAARRALRRRRAEAVLGGGGYVAGPAGLAAVGLRLPLVLTEADSHLGLANRLLARRARRVCLAFPIPGLDSDRFIVTGRPVPPGVLNADRRAARERFGIDSAARCLLVFGGSQGARSVNECAVDAFADGAKRAFDVLHVAGRRDYAGLRQRLDGGDGYRLLEYEPDLGDCLAACDLVLARAGGSIFELTAAGRPAVLVPYPHATAGHQTANAEWMAQAGAAVVVPDAELSPQRLREVVGGLLEDEAGLERMAAASRTLAKPDAAARIADEVLAAVGQRAGAPQTAGGEAQATGE